jgi:hypothetical protein
VFVCGLTPAATIETETPPAGKGATVSYAANTDTTVGFALPQPELDLRNERASKPGQLDPRQRLNS